MKASGASGQPRGRILVVDDDPAYSEYLRRVLSSGGFDVGHQPDAESALARVQAEQWDLLIADIQLPRVNGLELLGQVRELAPGLPVAILTGYASVDYEVSALAGAAAEFMQKPVHKSDLIARAAKLIEAGRAAREEAAAGAEPSAPGGDRGPLPRPRPPADPLAGIPADEARARSARSGLGGRGQVTVTGPGIAVLAAATSREGRPMAPRGIGIRMRVTIASAVALTLTAAVLAVALVAAGQARSHSDALAHRLQPADNAADDLAAMLTAEAGLLRAAVAGGQASGLKAVDTAESEVRAAAAQVGQLARGDPAMTAHVSDVATAHRAWTVSVADPQEAALRRGDVAAAQALQADNALVVPHVTDVRRAALGLQTEINGEQQAVASSLGRNHDVLLGALIALSLVALTIAAAVFISVRRGMLRSLERLASAVDAVAEGRYERPVHAAGPAELADLGRGVEQMRTTLVAALAERERAEENLRRLFDLHPDAVLGVARDGSVALANAEAVRAFGYPAGELIGRDVESLVPEDLRADLAERTEAYFADEQFRATWNATTWSMLRSDGTSFPCGIRMSTMPTEDATIIIVAVRDGTERVAIEAERERLRATAEHERMQRWQQQSQRLESLGQLVSGVAHDFNNLLGIISGYTEFTAEELQPLAAEDDRLLPLLKDIEQVQAAAQQAIRVTRQLLTFAKSKPANREVLNLNEMVDSAGQLLHRALGERIELVVAAGAGLWPVDADRGQLEQVLMNLAVNARDAMPDGGRLTITTANAEVDDGYAAERPGLKPGRYCRLAVADTGTGMDPETIERVFEPFFSTKPRGRGTGLGLATVYGIVSGLGGMIDISSEQGFGTTVNVLLPVSAQAAAAVPEPGLPAEKARGNGEVILLVEDEHSLRAMAGRLLARNGYQVREAADGDAAVRLAGDPAARFDLLITDMVMPGLLGNEVVDRVRALRPGLPALFITGHAQQVLDFHGITGHDLDIVQKPFTEAALLARVRRALEKARHGAPT